MPDIGSALPLYGTPCAACHCPATRMRPHAGRWLVDHVAPSKGACVITMPPRGTPDYQDAT